MTSSNMVRKGMALLLAAQMVFSQVPGQIFASDKTELMTNDGLEQTTNAEPEEAGDGRNGGLFPVCCGVHRKRGAGHTAGSR